MKTEAEILEAAKNGESEAQRKLYEEHFEPLYYFVLSKVNNKEKCEDICADVFIDAFTKLEQFKGDSNFKTWLFTIAKYKVVDWYRWKAKFKFFSIEKIKFKLPADQDNQENQNQQQKEQKQDQQSEELKEILSKLSKKQAEVLRLRFLADLKISEVAEILNMSESNVKVTQHRALKKAKEIMEVN